MQKLSEDEEIQLVDLGFRVYPLSLKLSRLKPYIP